MRQVSDNVILDKPKSFPGMNVIGWLGSALGACGALLLAMNIAQSMWGWVIFTASSLLLLLWSLLGRHYHQLAMQGVFFFTNLLGVYRWLITG
ncbi:MAG: hypothetical protein EP339_11690 [Gammaproteobacteria bacterium]|nr:MAG: hypothetical protein EP339_11690 [Gammaproteobacteria bacterium]